MSKTLAHLTVLEDYDAACRTAAEAVLEGVRTKPNSLICIATGASPLGLYAELARHSAELAQVRILKLDEWGGLAMNDPATCEVYIREKILGPWGLSQERLVGFQSDASDPEGECARIRMEIERAGDIDLCILGMGADGHIGLNYPSPMLPAEAHLTDASTLKHAMLDAALGLPTHGFTLGMAEVLRSRRIVLVVNGAAKARAAQRLMTGDISTEFPASLLWLHPDIHLFADRFAVPAL
jgi:galactosamine-6-phosphate isomerase